MNRPTSELDPEWKEYVEYLEGKGTARLQLELARVCDIIAEDLEKVSLGQKGLKLLSSEEKTFANILAVIKNKKDFMALAAVETETTTIKKTKVNIQDFVIKPK